MAFQQHYNNFPIELKNYKIYKFLDEDLKLLLVRIISDFKENKKK